jgi:hypothetical protein
VSLANSAVGGVNQNYTGDGYSGIYIWGAQLEAGSFPTSYIPTVASQVTRGADSASMTGVNFSSWYRQDEGSFYGEFNSDFVSYSDKRIVALYYPSLASVAGQDIVYQATGKAAIDYTTVSSMAVTGNSIIAPSFGRFAASIKPGDLAIAISGGTAATSSSMAFASIVPTEVYFGLRRNSTGYLNGHIKKLSYYPKRLSDSELQALTA